MGDEVSPVPSARRVLAVVCFLAAVGSFATGVPYWGGDACPSCTGLLTLVLPIAGTLFYTGLGVLAWRRPASAFLTHGLCFVVFVHACLVTEMLLQSRLCAPCLSIAGLALLAALVHAWRTPLARGTLAAGLLLGSLAGFRGPFERAEDSVTRRFWPAHVLSQAPSFVDRNELSGCPHARSVRLFTYEDKRVCQSCAGLEKRLLSHLSQDFPTEVCIHKHVLEKPEAGHSLPVLVLLSKNNRLIVYEGTPDYEDLARLLRDLIGEAAGR